MRFLSRLRVYAIVFASGASVMGIELAASRLYAPYFGASIYVWAGLIGSLLLFLCAGNFLGGALSRRKDAARTLSLATLAASLTGAAVPYIAYPIMNAASRGWMYGSNELPVVFAISIPIMALPIVLFGCVLPLAAGQIVSQTDRAGSDTGRLYGVSTAGSLAGVFLCALFILPEFGARMAFVIFAAPPALLSLAGFSTKAKIAALSFFIFLSATSRFFPVCPAPAGMKRIVEKDTPYTYVQIAKMENAVAMNLDSHGKNIYSMYTPGQARTGYFLDFVPMAAALSPDNNFPSSVCILGVAGGSVARVLRNAFPHADITGVEIDPELIRLGRKYMGLTDNDMNGVFIQDARRYIRDTPRKYDLIVLDVFNLSYVPFHLYTTEFFELLSDKMTPDGVLVINVSMWFKSPYRKLGESGVATLQDVFGGVYLETFKKDKENSLILATKSLRTPNLSSVRNEYIQQLLADENGYDFWILKQMKNAEKFTDDKSSIEIMTDRAMREILVSR